MIIRPAAPTDSRGIARVQVSSWRDAYVGVLAAETLANLNESEIAERRMCQLSEGMPMLVAEDAGMVIGYAVSGDNLHPEHAGDFEIKALYVVPEWQHRGVGRALVRTAIETELQAGKASMVIRAFEANHRARRVYEGWGGRFLGGGTFVVDGTPYPDVAYGFSDLSRLMGRLKPVEVREVTAQDSISEITALLHRAYERNASAGLKFNACHQDDARTKKRLSEGAGLVMVQEGSIIGTLSLCLFEDLPYGTFHPDGLVASFGQFAVEPRLSSLGLGDLLLTKAENLAREVGASFLACDTAQPADGLVAYYERHGFNIVGEVDYRPSTNYKSWVLAKALHFDSSEN